MSKPPIPEAGQVPSLVDNAASEAADEGATPAEERAEIASLQAETAEPLDLAPASSEPLELAPASREPLELAPASRESLDLAPASSETLAASVRAGAGTVDEPGPSRSAGLVDELRGVSRLAVEATQAVTGLVEAMHATIASGPAVLGAPLAGPARAATGLVYGAVRGVTALVGAGIDQALAQLAPLLPLASPGPELDAVRAALNGVLGDYLHDTGNPLALDMRLRVGAEHGAQAPSTGKLLVLVHGLAMHGGQWTQRGHDHGTALARALGYTPVYASYNSGRHISTNGQLLAAKLDELHASWPVPIEEIVLLGHSMGGLVARSAAHAGGAWRARLRRLITLGSPHHGAPLERAGNWLEIVLGVSRYSAPIARLARLRSAGVTDLRHGNVLDEHWARRDRFAYAADARTPLALPDDVRCYAVAATLSVSPAKRLLGDGLVAVDSALGAHATEALTLAFPDAQRAIAYGTGHLALLSSPWVFDTLHGWLSDEATPPREGWLRGDAP